jgi:hypothetical protein
VPALLDVSAPPLSGAAELVVSTGALEDAPLAEVSADGVIDGEGESVGVGDSLCDGDGEPESVGFDVVGLDEGGLVVGLVGDGLVCPPPEVLVPLGLSEGVPLPEVGVGSSDVP